jgi:hypothetical protein
MVCFPGGKLQSRQALEAQALHVGDGAFQFHAAFEEGISMDYDQTKIPEVYDQGRDHGPVFLAGIKKERPDPRALEGRQTLFVVNLAPRKMAGLVSEGMLFDIGYADSVTPVLAVPENPVANGTRAE